MPDMDKMPIPEGDPNFMGLRVEQEHDFEEETTEEPEAQEAAPEPEPEVQETAEEETEEKSNLAVAREALTAELTAKQPEVDATAALLAETRRNQQRERELLESRIAEKDEELKRFKEEKPAAPEAPVNLLAPEIVRATADASGIDAEEVERVLSTFAPAVQSVVDTTVKAKLEPYEKEREAAKEAEEKAETLKKVMADAEAGLADAYKLGGTAADLVKEYATLPADETFIGQAFSANPNVAMTRGNILEAVKLLAQEIDGKAEAVLTSAQGDSTTIPATSARRSQKLTEPKEQVTEADELDESLANQTGGAARAHPFMSPDSDIWK